VVKKIVLIHFLMIYALFILSGCASSDVSRTATANMDFGMQNMQNFVDPGDTNLIDSYENSSQATKGAILGGSAGAITGAFVSGIGVLPGALTGGLLGMSYGSYIDSKTTLKDQLENRGAIVVVLGDQILIVLPSERIFETVCSANIKSQAYSTLDLTAQYINSYIKMLVKVAAYTRQSNRPQKDLLLSQQQSISVARRLMVSGIDARVLYSQGYGGTRLVQQNVNQPSDNYRIEITLEKLYV
jgi:outer membrane protein OmpA-like peptidoglycan-associated protein